MYLNAKITNIIVLGEQMNSFENYFNIIINSKDLKDITQGYYHLTNNPIAIINSEYQLISFYSPFLVKDETWNQTITDGYVHINTYKKIENSLKNKDRMIITNLSSKRRLAIAIKEEDKTLAIIMILEEETKLEDIPNDYIYTFSELIKKIIKKNKFYLTNETKDSFFNSLINGFFKEKSLFLYRLNELKIADNEHKTMLIIDFSSNYNDNIIQSIVNFLKSYLNERLIAKTYIDKYFIALLNIDYKDIDTSKINSFFFSNRLYGILSANIDDLFAIPSIYLNTLKILKLLKKTLNHYELFEASKYFAIFPLLSLNNSELLYFIDQKILEIFHYDNKFNTSFIDTIYIYLMTNRSLIDTSKKLYVHKNTITYRLDKIKNQFSIDFDDYNNNLIYLDSILIVYYLKGEINKIII